MFTKEKLEAFAVGDTAVSFVRSVLVMEARAELIRERVDKYIGEVFSQFKFEIADRWRGTALEREITKRDDIFLADLDSDYVKSYWKACRAAHLANEFAYIVEEAEAKHPEHADSCYCPASIAESEHSDAKQALADYVADELGLPRMFYPHRDKLVDIITGAVINGPRGNELTLEKLMEGAA